MQHYIIQQSHSVCFKTECLANPLRLHIKYIPFNISSVAYRLGWNVEIFRVYVE